MTDEGLRTYRVFNRRYRNRRIGEFLKEMHLTQGRNTGFRKILNALEENGSPKPIFETDPERLSFCTTIRIHPLFLQNEEINEEINRSNDSLTEKESMVLKLILEKPTISISEMVTNLNISKSSVERAVKSLRNKRILARTGSRKDGEWIVLR